MYCCLYDKKSGFGERDEVPLVVFEIVNACGSQQISCAPVIAHILSVFYDLARRGVSSFAFPTRLGRRIH